MRAVFFDVDGTLLSHTRGCIPESALWGIRQLREQGIKVVIATGRHRQELDVLPPDGSFDGYCILNGQMCLDETRRPFFSAPITGGNREALLGLYNRGDYPVILVTAERFCINYVDETVGKVLQTIPGCAPCAGAYDGADVLMGCVFCPREEDEGITRQIGELKLARWHHLGADIIPPGKGKVQGILQFMKRWGLDRKEIMAFGDEENDMDMLSFAGIGVAMGNARQTVQAAADYVTAPIDEDGVLKALVHFGLA